MKDLPVVSIIIPAYNEVEVIGNLLASIKKQTYKNIEVIVVDDASSDETPLIAGKYGTKVFTRTHADRSVQRNFGAKVSKGSYLFFLDSDMELTPKVVEDAVETMQKSSYAAIVIPEKTVGRGYIQKVRRFEREMYSGDKFFEVARFFKRNIFFEYGGYDEALTGPEDYDLPYRISNKYDIGRSREYLMHNEERLTLIKLLRKKYNYAKKGAPYAFKHPKLVLAQGTILFRKVYINHWRKFIKSPFLGISFIFIRFLETCWAVAGFISAVGFVSFFKVVLKMFKK